MLDRFRDDSPAFFRGNDSSSDHGDMVNSGLLILTRAYHANHGLDNPAVQDVEAVSMVINWMIRQDADQLTDSAYDAKASQMADQLVAGSGLMEQEREDFITFTQACRQNAAVLGRNTDNDMTDHPAQG